MFFNTLKTVILLTALSGLLLVLGGIFGGTTGLQFALIMALIMNFIAYFFSDKIVLRMYRAQPLPKERYGYINTMVKELATSMKLPMPQLWIINTPMANAFATGRNPSHSSIALTSGILGLLDEEELRGVLSHELSHIKNRDILVSTIAATLATAIGYLANMLHYAAFWGSMSNNRKRGNPIFMLLIAILMPIAATLLQLAISRSREYLADETGSKHSHEPLALASALEKLHKQVQYGHNLNKEPAKASTASLFIVHPLSGGNWVSLFSTHPPIDKRIARLRKMAQKIF